MILINNVFQNYTGNCSLTPKNIWNYFKWKHFSHDTPEEGAKYTHLKLIKLQNKGKW